MTAEERAYKFYFERTGKVLAENSRPDMVIGYVAAYKDMENDVETWKRVVAKKEERIRELENKLLTIKNTVNG